jgi:acyl carrier protein
MINILENIEKVIVTEIATSFEKKSLNPDEDLLENGMIDSLGLMKLIDFMEKSFGVKILDEQIVPENFQSLNSMVRLVEFQLQGI